MTSSYAQIYEGAPRDSTCLTAWRKAEAERRFKREHFLALESEKCYVAELLLKKRVLGVLGITKSALLGNRRIQFVADRRHICMCVAYELSGLSTIALGKLFNRTRHMILHAQRRVNTNPELRAQADKVVAAVRKELRRK